MTVSLDPELESLIHRKVKTGLYRSESELVREALRMLEERDDRRELRRDDIRRAVAAGAASLRAGNGTDGEAFFDRIEAELDASESQGPA